MLLSVQLRDFDLSAYILSNRMFILIMSAHFAIPYFLLFATHPYVLVLLTTEWVIHKICRLTQVGLAY